MGKKTQGTKNFTETDNNDNSGAIISNPNNTNNNSNNNGTGRKPGSAYSPCEMCGKRKPPNREILLWSQRRK